ncbi:protein tyrosine phosphatase receptor type C-associated protein [Hyla sarda]|uniref:protein tyrosine phosphatase receptor type C-associated protein n=1 Tax=Hyla sarda TaxID=327740 RepID=UPI0024C45E24|nr:protein tyrosine phosphatase receptor type C-associated protein [Hyla sarda]
MKCGERKKHFQSRRETRARGSRLPPSTEEFKKVNGGDPEMENRIRNLGTLLVGSWFSLFPVTQAESSNESNDSTVTVVLLVLLLIVLCLALIMAWKRLIDTEGGEGYHPHVLWGTAQEFMQNSKTRWIPQKKEEEVSTVEDNEEEEEDEEPEPNEETDITAL